MFKLLAFFALCDLLLLHVYKYRRAQLGGEDFAKNLHLGAASDPTLRIGAGRTSGIFAHITSALFNVFLANASDAKKTLGRLLHCWVREAKMIHSARE